MKHKIVNNKTRTYKFKRFSLIMNRSDILLFIFGNKKVFIKNIRRKSHSYRFAKLGFASISFLILFILFSPMENFGSFKHDNSEIEDEAKKNSILNSSFTDFSEDNNNSKMVIRKHVVKKGENLSIIAKKYGVSIDTICGSSNLRSYSLIHTGAILRIPSRDGLLYKMKKGAKIASIAKKYKVSLDKIIASNDLKNPDFIPSGRVLFIPDAKPQNIFPGYLWPTSSRSISCGFGWRRNPFHGRGKEFHQGLDIRVRYGWIRSTRYGKVTYAGWMGGYGKVVIVSHPNRVKSLYAHLSRIIVRKGQYVKQGQRVARSGNTGRSTGPHLHFEIIKNGKHQNPYRVLKRKRL
jgi:murein DD-endopeptidase MepM/ murein hydrolase activator NlpD